jgi:tetratricopeptide (TPR) repeat protein
MGSGKGLWAAGLLLLPLGGLQAQNPPTAAPPTVQQLFEKATQAEAADDTAAALAALDALESRVGKNARSLAIVRVRKGMALARTGRSDEARDYLARGLAGLPADDPSLREDRMVGADKAADLALTDLDYSAAAHFYEMLRKEASQPGERLRALMGLAQANMFIDPAAALGNVVEAERINAAGPALPKDQLALIAQVKGRALLNLGRFAEAETVLAQAVKGQGGLSLKVDYNDLAMRSDASIAALLAGHQDKAREYLVYTGAGRLPEQDFTSGADMPLPPCGVDGVEPQDRAVVAFGIGDDGTVVYAQPVYGSKPGALAVNFAQAVREWTWKAQDVQKIPPLFRLSTRLELRCSTEGEGPSIGRPAVAALNEWLSDIGAGVIDGRGVALAQLIGRYDEMWAQAPDAPGLLAQGLIILSNPALTGSEWARFAPLVSAQADRRAPPPLARLAIEASIWTAEQRARRSNRSKGVQYPLVEARYASDPEARNIYRLLRYDALKSGEKKREAALLDQVIDDPAVEKDSPLKAGALVRRANLRASTGDMAGAQADFQRTGLNDAQCSLVDAKPALQSASTSSADYPTDMFAVGIEGWTRIQFDIGADGRTLNQRAVISYPPMAFDRNGEKILARARYEQSFRPGGHLGCGGNQATIHFKR